MLNLEELYIGTKIRDKKTGKEYIVVVPVYEQINEEAGLAKWYVTCEKEGNFYNLNLISDDYEFVTILTEKQLDVLYSKFKLMDITLDFDLSPLSVPFSYLDIRKMKVGPV